MMPPRLPQRPGDEPPARGDALAPFLAVAMIFVALWANLLVVVF